MKHGYKEPAASFLILTFPDVSWSGDPAAAHSIVVEIVVRTYMGQQ